MRYGSQLLIIKIIFVSDPEPPKKLRIITNSKNGTALIRWETVQEIEKILCYELFYIPVDKNNFKCNIQQTRIFITAVIFNFYKIFGFLRLTRRRYAISRFEFSKQHFWISFCQFAFAEQYF